VSTLLLAASGTSKVPFFIAGGALAAWAVILAAIGLNRPDFPGDLRGQRAVIAITFTIVVITIGMAIVTS
jgi:hypothetical protein